MSFFLLGDVLILPERLLSHCFLSGTQLVTSSNIFISHTGRFVPMH